MDNIDERARQHEGVDWEAVRYLDKVPVRRGPDWPVIFVYGTIVGVMGGLTMALISVVIKWAWGVI